MSERQVVPRKWDQLQQMTVSVMVHNKRLRLTQPPTAAVWPVPGVSGTFRREITTAATSSTSRERCACALHKPLSLFSHVLTVTLHVELENSG